MIYAKNIKIVLAIVIINLCMLSTPLFSRATELPDEKYVNPYAKECPDGYTKIETVDDLLSINNNPSGNYILMNDIDLSGTKKGGEYDTGHGWTPIKSFSGTLDGNGYRICNLTIYGDVGNYTYTYCDAKCFGGLFDVLDGGLVENLGLTDTSITVENAKRVGGLCGYCYRGEIVNCYISGEITVANEGCDIGGIVGYNYGKVNDCISLANINGHEAYSYLGGIAGYGGYGGSGALKNCINIGNVKGTYCGGIYKEGSVYDHNYYLSTSVYSDSGSVVNNEYQKALTESLMMKKGSFTGFDFVDTWELDPYCEAYKYPQLKTNRVVRVLDIDVIAPTKKVYYQGDGIDLSGSKITIYYEGDDSFPTTIKKDMLSGYDMSEVGEQTVTVTYGGIKKTFDIEVKEIPVESVSLPSNISIYRPDSKQLEADITPKNATDKSLVWETSDSSVVTVDGKGVIKAKGPGTAKITATSGNGKKSSCEVTVGVKCSSIEFDKTKVALELGKTDVIKAQMIPLDCTEELKWKSNDENIVQVVDGNITAVAGGSAVVTAYTDNGIETYCNVYVISNLGESGNNTNTTTSDNTNPQNQNNTTTSDNTNPQNQNNTTTSSTTSRTVTAPTTDNHNNQVKKPAKPNKVKGVKIKAKKGKLVISWKKVSNAERYEIFVSTKKNFSGKKKYYTSKKSITIPNIKAGKKHYIKIRGYNSYYDYYGEEAFVDGPWTTATKKAK